MTANTPAAHRRHFHGETPFPAEGLECTVDADGSPVPVLPQEAWQEHARAHEARLAPWVKPHVERRSRGVKHPVWDFLFEYYSFRPSHLLKWSPGVAVVLQGPAAELYLNQKEFTRHPNGLGVWLSPATFPAKRLESARVVLQLLEATAARPATFACYGLHEWAMVYRSETVRHSQLPLRLSQSDVDQMVDESCVRCSHYDAFRFFTPDAIPLNTLNPGAENRPQFEQPGCIHANMDLYKWAYKFYPWISSELIAEAFELACAAREVDMRASPYDVRELGLRPICIETAAGKAEYVAAQRELAERSRPVRLRLIEEYRRLLGAVTAE